MRRVIMVLFAFALFACADEGSEENNTNSNNTTTPNNVTTPNNENNTNGGDGPQGCEDRGQSPTSVSETQVNEAYPDGEGGPIVDGVYHLSDFEVFAPATADDNVRQGRMEFANGRFHSTTISAGTTQILGGTYSTSGNEVTLNVDCPGAQMVTMQYSATPSSFVLFDTSEPNRQVYTKQ